MGSSTHQRMSASFTEFSLSVVVAGPRRLRSNGHAAVQTGMPGPPYGLPCTRDRNAGGRMGAAVAHVKPDPVVGGFPGRLACSGWLLVGVVCQPVDELGGPRFDGGQEPP